MICVSYDIMKIAKHFYQTIPIGDMVSTSPNYADFLGRWYARNHFNIIMDECLKSIRFRTPMFTGALRDSIRGLRTTIPSDPAGQGFERDEGQVSSTFTVYLTSAVYSGEPFINEFGNLQYPFVEEVIVGTYDYPVTMPAKFYLTQVFHPNKSREQGSYAEPVEHGSIAHRPPMQKLAPFSAAKGINPWSLQTDIAIDGTLGAHMFWNGHLEFFDHVNFFPNPWPIPAEFFEMEELRYSAEPGFLNPNGTGYQGI